MAIAKMLLTFVLTFSAVGAGVFGIVKLAIRINELCGMAIRYREWEEVIKQIEGGSSEY